ncbi:MAG: hypothetical protein ACSHW1_08465 [Yoonia sp.]|uniref:hypothetical protein n=1 Tax=Yoonia sp. TaxID=2212373 RepID=UPI003EF1BECE
MKLRTLASATALTAACTIANAQDSGDISVGVGLSTFGANLEAAYQITPDLRARGALMGGLNLDFEESDDADIEGEFNLGGAALLADYYPLQNGWRVSGGLFFSNTDLTATGTVETEPGPVSRSATVSAQFENEIAPMITTGYDWSFSDSWALTSELGVIFGGGIDLSFETDDAADQAAIDDDPDVQEAIADAADITVLPYLSLGVSYRF